jgi:hypothetical protein
LISYALDKFEQVGKIDPYNEELAAKVEGLKTAYRLSRTNQ